MNYKIENKKDYVEIEVVFTAAEWEAEVDAAYKASASKYNVQGFRKGKAPRGVIEKNYGTGIFGEEALRSAVSREYAKILKEHPEIKPIDYISIKEFSQVDGARIVFTVDVEPKFTLGKYTGIVVKKVKAEVSDKDVEEYLQGQARQRARQVAADKGHKVANGDIAVIDFVGSVDGVEFEGGKASGHELEIGSGQFIPGFEEALVGAAVGDVVDVKVTFPAEYHAENLAGKPAVFKTTVKNILIKQVPAVDDQFAKEVSEFQSLAEYKKDVYEKLLKMAEDKAEKDTQNELLKSVAMGTKIDVPSKMVDAQLDNIMKDLEYRLMYQGLNLETYARYMKTTPEAIREQQRENAAESVKSRLVFDAIAEKEMIVVTPAELDAEVKRIATANNKKEDEYKKNAAQMEYIEQSLKFDKIIKFLEKNNSVK